ncbi:MAG: hypothetical protein ACI85I_001619 [Arenicella sp.]|jgi:hypothetical protein
MSKKTKLLIAFNLVLLVAIAFSWQTNSAKSNQTETLPLAEIDTANIQQITVGDLVLEADKGKWKLNSKFMASERRMDFLLSAFGRLDSKRPVSQKEIEQITQLPPNKLTTMEITGADNSKTSFQFANLDNETFLITGNNEAYFNIHIQGIYLNIYDLFSAPITEWREKKILQTSWQTLKSMQVEYAGDSENGFQIAFENNFYSVQGVKKLDSGAVYNYITQYQDFSVLEFLPKSANLEDSLRKTTPLATIKIEDLYEERGGILEIYPSNQQIYGWLKKEDELVLLNPKMLQNFLVPKQAFVRKEN